MNKADIVAAMADNANISKVQAGKAIDAALATIEDVAERLRGRSIDDADLARIRAHLERYGARPA